MEVVPGIHRIEAPLGDRFVAMYLLVGSDHAMLIDTGLDSNPREHVVPYLAQIGLKPEKIKYVLISHADFDHTGGIMSTRELLPDAVLMCHELDREMIESVDMLINKRYRGFVSDHGMDETPESIAFINSTSRHAPMDITVTGGEKAHLESGWEVEILHTPGHSQGHVSVYDARSHTAIILDAALWNAVLRKDGTVAFPPTYRYIDTYIATIQRLQGMKIDTLLTSHYPVYQGGGVVEFLAESRAYVDRVDNALRTLLRHSEKPLTMREIIDSLSAKLGSWADGGYLVWPLSGHIERLELYGFVEKTRRGDVAQYRWKVRD